jgi:hypothetical protein
LTKIDGVGKGLFGPALSRLGFARAPFWNGSVFVALAARVLFVLQCGNDEENANLGDIKF